VECGAGMRILTGAGAVAVMGPAVLSFHNKGTLLCHDTIHMSQQNAYVTEQDTCHSTTHMSWHNTHVTAQYICHSTPVTAHYTCHKASGPCNTRYRHRLHNMQQEVLHSTYAAQVCSKHTCCLTVLLQSTNMHMADTHMCMSQKAMQAILLMRINCCKRRMTACC